MRKLAYIIPLLLLFTGCRISYKFNGTNIDYAKIHTISVADFPNNAALVNPTLSNNLSEAIRDIYSRQTRLESRKSGADLEVEGEITGYALTPMAIAANSYSAETKLTITIQVHFTNNIEPEQSFDRTYSAFQTFDSSRMLTDVQDELCQTMIEELAENIYNDTVARW